MVLLQKKWDKLEMSRTHFHHLVSHFLYQFLRFDVMQWSPTSARWQRRIEIQTTVDSQTVWATCFKLETWIRSEPCLEERSMEPMRSAFVVAGVGWQAHNLCILQTTLDGTWIRSEIWLEKLKSFIYPPTLPLVSTNLWLDDAIETDEYMRNRVSSKTCSMI